MQERAAAAVGAPLRRLGALRGPFLHSPSLLHDDTTRTVAKEWEVRRHCITCSSDDRRGNGNMRRKGNAQQKGSATSKKREAASGSNVRHPFFPAQCQNKAMLYKDAKEHRSSTSSSDCPIKHQARCIFSCEINAILVPSQARREHLAHHEGGFVLHLLVHRGTRDAASQLMLQRGGGR